MWRRPVPSRPTSCRYLCWLALLALCCLSLWCRASPDHAAVALDGVECDDGAQDGPRGVEVEEAGVCADFSFSLFLAATMGTASSTHALTTCGLTPYSTIFHDVALSHHHRDVAGGVADGLWRLTHGNADPLTFFDNAHLLLGLRAEIEAWIRANRTIGMAPSAYEAVVQGVGAVLGLNASLLGQQPSPALMFPDAEGTEGAVNWTERMAQCGNGTVMGPQAQRCLLRTAQEAYRAHAKAVLNSPLASSLLVSNATFTRARRYYERVVFPGIIVRTMNLDPQTTANDFDRNLHGLLRGVQYLWDTVAAQVAAEAEAAPSPLPPPFLPLIQETDFTGPQRRETRTAAHEDAAYPSPSRHSGARLQALRRQLPTAVVYQTGADCRSCHLFDQAFDLLPAVYKRMCSHGYRSIVSCSPITLFLRTTHLRPFQWLPSVDIFARQVHNRAAVLRLAEQKLVQLSHGDAAASAQSDADDADASADIADDVQGSAFYSLRSRYEKLSAALEEALLPRSHFEPMRLPLRPQPEVTTVEEAVVSLVGDLVGSGMIQFLFLDPSEVARIALENARVTRLVKEQREREQAARAEGGNDTAEAGQAGPAATPNSTAATAAAPSPAANPEDHPQYRKVVSFRELSAKLVQMHTRALFGDVDKPLKQRRGRRSGDRVPALLRHLAWLWYLVELPRTLWDMFFAHVDRLLFVTAFALLCLYQHRWNRSQRVSYW